MTTKSLVVLASSALLALAGCQLQSPADVQSSIIAPPELYAVNPADIAVLPIEDATPDRRAAPHIDLIRSEIALALVSRLYSPLTTRAVDAPLAVDASVSKGSATDTTRLARLAGKFGEDALLGVRIQTWDESALMATNRLRFSADVAMVESKQRKLIWSGTISGDVKAGGTGPAPLDRDAKARSAAAGFARELMSRLPCRRP